jgi:hypothetical protein
MVAILLNGFDVMNVVILYGFACLNECVQFGCVYGYTVYYVNLLCWSFYFLQFFNPG